MKVWYFKYDEIEQFEKGCVYPKFINKTIDIHYFKHLFDVIYFMCGNYKTFL